MPHVLIHCLGTITMGAYYISVLTVTLTFATGWCHCRWDKAREHCVQYVVPGPLECKGKMEARVIGSKDSEMHAVPFSGASQGGHRLLTCRARHERP